MPYEVEKNHDGKQVNCALELLNHPFRRTRWFFPLIFCVHSETSLLFEILSEYSNVLWPNVRLEIFDIASFQFLFFAQEERKFPRRKRSVLSWVSFLFWGYKPRTTSLIGHQKPAVVSRKTYLLTNARNFTKKWMNCWVRWCCVGVEWNTTIWQQTITTVRIKLTSRAVALQKSECATKG